MINPQRKKARAVATGAWASRRQRYHAAYQRAERRLSRERSLLHFEEFFCAEQLERIRQRLDRALLRVRLGWQDAANRYDMAYPLHIERK